MSEPAGWVCVSASSGPQSVTVASCCFPTVQDVLSPIDAYYEFSEKVLQLGDASALANSPILGRLLLLGLVSGVEAYLRSVLAGVLKICPLSRKQAADQPLTLSALDYYGIDEVELGLFDRSSLAGANEVRSWTKRLLGLDLDGGCSAALSEYDLVCHLRHASVHAQGILGSGNARELGLAAPGRQSVSLDFGALQQVGAVCHGMVRSYNRWLYERMLRAGTTPAFSAAFGKTIESFSPRCTP